MRALLERGAAKDALRASLPNFSIGPTPRCCHEARDVTAAEWARGFPEQGWVNIKGMLLKSIPWKDELPRTAVQLRRDRASKKVL
jgi:hypothetical protein